MSCRVLVYVYINYTYTSKCISSCIYPLQSIVSLCHVICSNHLGGLSAQKIATSVLPFDTLQLDLLDQVETLKSTLNCTLEP